MLTFPHATGKNRPVGHISFTKPLIYPRESLTYDSLRPSTHTARQAHPTCSGEITLVCQTAAVLISRLSRLTRHANIHCEALASLMNLITLPCLLGLKEATTLNKMGKWYPKTYTSSDLLRFSMFNQWEHRWRS